MTKILLIGEATQSTGIVTAIKNEGYTVFSAHNGHTGLKTAWKETPQLVILDLKLPDLDGYEACRRLRELGVAYILVTSYQQDEHSIIRALELGADDFLRHPLTAPILMAKIATLVRRNAMLDTSSPTVFDDGHLLVDLERRRVMVKDQPVKLTPTEFRLLSILMRQAGRVVTHEDLIKEIWGTEKNTSLGSLKLYVYYLRQKIEISPKKPRYLLAEWGVGYRFREAKQGATAPVTT